MEVLVAVDRSDVSERALDAIAGWAATSGTKVYLLTVLDPKSVEGTTRQGFVHSLTPEGSPSGQLLYTREPYPTTVEDRSQAFSRALDEHGDALEALADRRLPGVQTKVVVEVNGDVPGTIIEVAKRLGVAFVAMGTHGRTGVRHALVGSVAEEVMRKSPVPVLLVGPSVAAPA